MPEPNATPAPLTMTPERERFARAVASDLSATSPMVDLLAELDATRAKLADTTEDSDSLKVLLREAESTVERLGAKLARAEALRDTSAAQLASLGPKLAEAEAKLARYDAPVGGLGVFAEALAERERLQYEPHLRREMRRADEAEAKLTAAESRVAALTAELAGLEWLPMNGDDAASECPVCGHEKFKHHKGCSLQAALSPSQDAKTGGDV